MATPDLLALLKRGHVAKALEHIASESFRYHERATLMHGVWHYAIRRRRYAVLDAMCSRRTRIRVHGRRVYSWRDLVGLAVTLQDTKALRVMLSHTTDINTWPSRSTELPCTDLTPLSRAVEFNNHELVQEILRFGDVNATNRDGSTALFRAFRFPALTRLLLRHGARVDIKDTMGRTALWKHVQTTGRNPEVVRLLCSAGAELPPCPVPRFSDDVFWIIEREKEWRRRRTVVAWHFLLEVIRCRS
jgi:ankyrin repeat protein